MPVHIKKVCGGVEVLLHSFLTSTLDEVIVSIKPAGVLPTGKTTES